MAPEFHIQYSTLIRVPEGPEAEAVRQMVPLMGGRIVHEEPSPGEISQAVAKETPVVVTAPLVSEVSEEMRKRWQVEREGLRPLVESLRNPPEERLHDINNRVAKLAEDVKDLLPTLQLDKNFDPNAARVVLSEWFESSLPVEIPSEYVLRKTGNQREMFHRRSQRGSTYFNAILPQQMRTLGIYYGLSTGEDISIPEIAKREGITVVGVKNRLGSALIRVSQYSEFRNSFFERRPGNS